MSRADLACRFAAVLLLGLVSLAGAAAVKAEDAGEEHATERQFWPFAGFRGQYDQAQLQLGELFLVGPKVTIDQKANKRVSRIWIASVDGTHPTVPFTGDTTSSPSPSISSEPTRPITPTTSCRRRCPPRCNCVHWRSGRSRRRLPQRR